ncbi:MAG: PspA/IM30 family protein [Candidatus Lambdaproteobacteria bacterium]|nr:PspA/IM30 family protein [Candidatus Lambdaproteobacteria bacterium]
MGLLSRFFTVVRANLNALLNLAEDPAKLLDQTVLDLNAAYQKAKDQVARSMADQKRMEKALLDQRGEVQKWEGRAVLAVEKGDDELAREALRRKNEHAALATQFDHELGLHTANVDKLKQSLRELETKIGEFRRRKNLLVSKHRRAEAQEQIGRTMEAMQGVGALDTAARMEEKIDQLAATAEAKMELSQEFQGDALERKFKQLQPGPDVERELLELKQRVQIEHKPGS